MWESKLESHNLFSLRW